MFRAILSGKAGRIVKDISAGMSWVEVFRQTEDLLTATVFERLCYLDAPLFWDILKQVFGSTLPAYRVARLVNVEFWPRWADTMRDGQVEPDIFLQFEVGDPTQKVDLIVEAKLGGFQYALQWNRQWNAYKAHFAAPDSDDHADKVILLAIGGVGDSADATTMRISKEIEVSSGGTQVVAAAADWSKLVSVLAEAALADDRSVRIVEDVQEALSLFGYRNMRPMNSISDYTAPVAADRSLDVILRSFK